MRSSGVKLTTFTIFTIFVTFWLASIIGGLSLFKDTYSVNAVFSDATGVLKGDPVKVAGVEVGRVTHFEVEDGAAVLTLEIRKEVELPSNVEADIRYRNLLGQRIVNLLEPEDPERGQLADGDTIELDNTKAALDLAIVFNNLRPLIQSTNPEDINTVARAVLEVFKGREKDLAGILGNVGRLAKTLSARDDRLARLVVNLRGVTDVLNDQSSNIGTSLDRFSTFLESLNEVTPVIEDVIAQLDDASQRFGGILKRNRTNLDDEIRDLNILLGIVDDNLGPLDRIARNLKEVLLGTARSQSYGKWWNLYVVNLCPEAIPTGCGGL
ncbi:MAG TPA: MlaD family protein [Actinomycetota bacterium]|nr:MlaD family protein [Actinomycetota bacterium]